jgi:hypothetical protein
MHRDISRRPTYARHIRTENKFLAISALNKDVLYTFVRPEHTLRTGLEDDGLCGVP